MAKKKTQIHEVAISKFKAQCLSLLDQVSKTKRPLRVTRRGRPLADVVPAPSEVSEASWIGSMSGTIEIIGDIVSPIIDLDSIEALKK